MNKELREFNKQLKIDRRKRKEELLKLDKIFRCNKCKHPVKIEGFIDLVDAKKDYDNSLNFNFKIESNCPKCKKKFDINYSQKVTYETIYSPKGIK